MLRTALALLAFGILVPGALAAVDEKRVALVIGNSDYAHTTVLKNPRNDARDLAGSLRRLGFQVIEGLDLDQSDMRSKIREFTTAIDGADVALFFYAGHGLQVQGKNYLAPVNARLERESDLDFETVQLNLVLRQMEREKRTNLVFLDACRDNPLSERLARSMATRSAAIGRGLARVESGVGMLIGYATSPGMVALDGDGRNSPYTKALLSHIEKPGVSINDLMISVRQDVLKTSRGKQVPWEHSSLTGPFMFKRTIQTAALSESEPSPASSGPTTSNLAAYEIDREKAISTAFQATVTVGTCGAYKAFEEQHRGTFYARLAEEWITTNCGKSERAIIVEEKATETTSTEKPADETKPAAGTKSPTGTDVKVAATDATAKTPETPAAPVLAGRELVVAMQTELKRVGCSPGTVDGQFGGQTKRALQNFNRYAKLSLSTTAPDNATLTLLKAKTGRVCPLVCGPRHVSTGDACVLKTCPSGKVLSRRGTCVVVARKATPRQAAPARKAPPTTSRARKAGPKEDRYWGGEDSRVDCERGVFTDKCFAPR